MPVSGIQSIHSGLNVRPLSTAASSDQSFADVLKGFLEDVNRLQREADVLTTQLALGQVEDLHQVTIATEKAYLALQLTTAIRNKVVEAYQEISRMQL